MAERNAAALVKAERYAAIAAATTVEELDTLWAAWARVGHSTDGLLYAAVLARKSELGAELSDDEQATIELAELRRTRGASMPTIRGKRR